MFSTIVFDLDGTLTDNTEGINNSLIYTLDQMSINTYTDELLQSLIGPPLQWGFKHVFGMNERDIKLAVEHFRSYYAAHGWHQNVPYDGVMEMLAELDAQGKKMYIATAKYEKFAQKIIEHFEMDKYIIQTKGADYGGIKAEKHKIIAAVLETNQLISSEEIVMVGDTIYDIRGGKENGLATIAVNYGFGKEVELKDEQPNYFVEDVEELYELLAM
jgi:phosphoglycolate phosphatase